MPADVPQPDDDNGSEYGLSLQIDLVLYSQALDDANTMLKHCGAILDIIADFFLVARLNRSMSWRV